jgi:protein TilB
MISTLEEITMHQEELESINEVLGMTCRKLKILYLQNNIIKKMENLNHMKELEYVNLALNNISKIEGLQNCEFLKKLDLTVNFIDLDELKSSIDHLVDRDRLKDLYLMGNPSEANWGSFKSYVIAKLPQLTNLDGTDITKSMQIVAKQKLPEMEKELKQLAILKRREKAQKEKEKEAKAAGEKIVREKKKKEARVVELDENDNEIQVEDASSDEEEDDPNEMTENTPEVREEIYRELAQQKREKEERDNANKPRERNYEKEQKEAVEAIRAKEEEESGVIKQKNEGNWEFLWDEDSRPGSLILELPLPRHLDSSLIDVDVHPGYVSIIIKSKTLRLRTLCEVKAEQSKCQRAKVNGHLQVIMPKVNRRENITTFNSKPETLEAKPKKAPPPATLRPLGTSAASAGTAAKPKKLSMHEQMLADAMAQAGIDEEKVKAVANTVQSKTGKNKVSYGGTLDGNKRGVGAQEQVSSIVKKKRDDGDAKRDEEILDVGAVGEGGQSTVFTGAVRAIEELD